MKHYVDLIGRIAIGIFFGYEAFDLLDSIHQTRSLMTTYGITVNQDLLLYAAAAFLSLGSILLAFGYRSRLAAFLLLLYWLPVTMIVHSFWTETGPAMKTQALMFMNNLAIAGGLLLIIAHGTGKFAVRKLFATAKV